MPRIPRSNRYSKTNWSSLGLFHITVGIMGFYLGLLQEPSFMQGACAMGKNAIAEKWTFVLIYDAGWGDLVIKS